jgi:predicted dehydrogenase
MKLITLDPAHFHAALLQKEMYPDVCRRAAVYAPFSSDLIDHLNRIVRFNTRAANPTCWELDVYSSPDFRERMLADRAGDIVVLAGRNRGKIDSIQSSVNAGLHVLADKPWVIASADLPKIDATLETAERNGIVAYDIMTERFEITSLLQKELVNDPDVFGAMVAGSAAEPGVYMRSVHNILKTVAGVPSLRPVSFLDIREQGEALADVGTHLVDLVQWTLHPEQPLDYRADIQVLAGKRWPTVMTAQEFQRATGVAAFPAELDEWVEGGKFEYYSNNQVQYTIRGVHVTFDVLWDYEAPAGAGDSHFACYRGTKARAEVRQGVAERYRPELYLIPEAGQNEIRSALARRVEKLQARYPGIGIEDSGREFLVTIPDSYRVGHEAHFAQVAKQFFEYLKDPQSLPKWERPNMLAKYFVASKGVELSRA